MDGSELVRAIRDGAEECASRPQCTSVVIHRDAHAIEIVLDNKTGDYHSEHIPGEGADIALYRDMVTGKVVGARLPLTVARVCVGDTAGVDLTIEPYSPSNGR